LPRLRGLRVRVLDPAVAVETADLAVGAIVERELHAAALGRHAHEDAGVEGVVELHLALELEARVRRRGVEQAAGVVLAGGADEAGVFDGPDGVAVVVAAARGPTLE